MGATVSDSKAWAEFWEEAESPRMIGGAYSKALVESWAAFFSDDRREYSQRSLIIDIAAGSGAALNVAAQLFGDSTALLAVDYSADALAAARSSASSALGVAADAARLPLRAHSADLVVSQFGVEYAGLAAFGEAARILAPNGRFRAISHYGGGSIDEECASNERILKAGAAPSLFSAARRTFNESFRRRDVFKSMTADAALERIFAKEFKGAEQAAASAPHLAARATIERFLTDLSRLSARRLAFDRSETMSWLDSMEATFDAYKKRMRSMRSAALDDKSICKIAQRFSDEGLIEFSASPMHLDKRRAPAGWIIEAKRPPQAR